jgi:hypothetical protein
VNKNVADAERNSAIRDQRSGSKRWCWCDSWPVILKDSRYQGPESRGEEKRREEKRREEKRKA